MSQVQKNRDYAHLLVGMQVTKVASGARSMTAREMYLRAEAPEYEVERERVNQEFKKLLDPSCSINAVTEVIDHTGKSFFKNALGEWL